MDQLTGSVTRLVFRNPETSYTVLRLAPVPELRVRAAGGEREPMADAAGNGHSTGDTPGRADAPSSDDGQAGTGPRQASFIEADSLPRLVTVVGELGSVEVGQQLWVSGEWVEHPQHGRQFRADQWKVQLPTSLAGMQAYLASGLVRGIGPSLASAIVSLFGDKTFDVIENEPRRLLEVPGIGESRVKIIRDTWQEHSDMRELMAFLQGFGLAPALAMRVARALGPNAAGIAQSQPYRLAGIAGIGFKTADHIAEHMGIARDAEARMQAGLLWALEEFCGQGHSFALRSQLVQAAADLLALPAEPVAACLDRMAAAGESLRAEDGLGLAQPAIYTTALYRAETETARRLLALAAEPRSCMGALREELNDQQIHWAAAVAGQSTLSAEQRLAIRRVIENKLSIITGGPGTGKTICLRSLVALLELYHLRCVLVSPTGRAARRLAEATGHPALTVHRLLRYSGQSFAEDELEADVVVVDEASMLDLTLTQHLLAALKPGAHLVLVGDADQLPAVGPGTVLADLAASGLAAMTRLTHIFRQAQSSLIVTNAHRINRGQPLLAPQQDCDFYLFAANDAGQAAELLIDVVCRRIPAQFGASLGLTDPLRDIQVLAPMYRGRAGIDRLNAQLQDILNPPAPGKPERALQRCVFRQGDKVIVTRNNYERDVSNGDVGYVVEIDEAQQLLRVECDGRIVTYDWMDTDDLALAYAISVHKAQGSEYAAVVVPVLAEHSVMLYRQLLYTAITRARRLCVLVGSRRAIAEAIETNRGPKRG
jgi:exodeoxyribonuclease V alpha subunit